MIGAAIRCWCLLLMLLTASAWADGGAAAPNAPQYEKITTLPAPAPAPERKSASGIFHFSCSFASDVSAHKTQSASGFSARGLRIRIGSKDPTGLDWVWNFSGVLADGGEWVWDDKWEGRDGVKLTDAPDIAQRKPPAALSGFGRIGADWFIEQGLGQFLGNSDQELRQVRLRAQREIAEEKAAGSWGIPAMRPKSDGYVNPDPRWVQSLDQFQNNGSRAAVVIQSGLAAVVLAPVAAAAWAESSLYARAFVKNPWLMTKAAVVVGGGFVTANGPAIVDTLADTGRVTPALSGLGSQLSKTRELVSFLRNEGISDASIRRKIWESGLKEIISSDTPVTLDRFRRIFVRPLSEGKALTGRFGNVDTRVATLLESSRLESRGLTPFFEWRVGRRFADIAGVDPVSGEVSQLIQLVKALRSGGINPRELDPVLDIIQETGIIPRTIITGAVK